MLIGLFKSMLSATSSSQRLAFAFVVFIGLFHQSEMKNFTCRSGQKVDNGRFCDGTMDCEDGSDEEATDDRCDNCGSDEVSCNPPHGRHSCTLHRQFICDGIIKCSNVTPCDVGCTSHYRCVTSTLCFPRSSLCDGDGCNGCAEDTEWASGPGFKCIRNGRVCLLPQQLVRDDVKDCDKGEDLCYVTDRVLSSKLNEELCFECFDRKFVIPSAKVCDGVIDCPDLSDECLCEGEVPTICNYVTDYFASSTNHSDAITCQVGQVSCGNGKCVNRSSVCDGIKDCDDARDEKYEFCRGTLKCNDATIDDINYPCRCNKECQAIYGMLCDGVGECPAPGPSDVIWKTEPGFPDDECSNVCFITNILKFRCRSPIVTFSPGLLRHNLTQCQIEIPPTLPGMPVELDFRPLMSHQWCDGVIDCSMTSEDESIKNCPHRFRCKAAHRMSIPREKVCDGVPDCDDMSDEINDACSERFFCPVLGNLKISIPREHVCDFDINCDDASDEINCHDDMRYYCESGKRLFVSKKQLFDGSGDCDDWSDECPSRMSPPDHKDFSSTDHLIASPFVRGFVWVMGIFAVGGNLIVISGQIKLLLQIQTQSNLPPKSLANHVLVLNLALSDLLMGVYLVMLGGAGAVYCGDYCAKKLSWLSSATCKFMGVLVVISSESSVVTIVMMMSCRIHSEINTFNASSRPAIRFIVSLILLKWVLCFFLALIPLSGIFQNIFAERAILRHNYFFKNSVVNFESAKHLTEKMMTFDLKNPSKYFSVLSNHTSAESWCDLQNILSSHTNHEDYLMTSQWLGYYSANSVCIPQIYSTPDVSEWSFSFAIILFNFLSFVFVSTSYVITSMKSRKSQSIMKHHRSWDVAGDLALQQKITRIIITNSACWIFICIIAFINLAGIKMPKTVYVISSVILLPIRSALNPILHSSFVDACMKRIQKKTSFLDVASVSPPESPNAYESTRV